MFALASVLCCCPTLSSETIAIFYRQKQLQLCMQIETGDPICWLSSANLMEVAPTFHIARFLPSITESKAPFTFALQVSDTTPVSLAL